jgi:hypothetical protein
MKTGAKRSGLGCNTPVGSGSQSARRAADEDKDLDINTPPFLARYDTTACDQMITPDLTKTMKRDNQTPNTSISERPDDIIAIAREVDANGETSGSRRRLASKLSDMLLAKLHVYSCAL